MCLFELLRDNILTLTSSGFGSELKDVDLADLNDNTRDIVVNGFYQSGGTLLIRNQQHLSPEQLCDFVALFGTVEKNEKLTAVHSYNHLNEFLRLTNPHRPPLSAELLKELPPITRPLVARHPVTDKKPLYHKHPYRAGKWNA